MRVRLIDERDRDRFNTAVAASPYADVLQSYEWGEIKRATGWEPLRFIVEDAAGVRGTALVLRLRALRGVPPLLYAPRGPVLDFSDTAALHALLDAIRAHAGGGFLFKCDPPVDAGSDAAGALRAAGLRAVQTGAFGGVQPIAIMELDVDQDAEKIFEGFKNKWRYNVRLAERKGVTVREGARSDIGAFHALYAQTAQRDGFTGRPRSYFERLWDVLEPIGMLKMWVAEYDGMPLSSIICTMIGSRVIYNYGASSNEHRSVMPNHLIQWTAIRWAHDAGYKIYDFRGVSPIRKGEPAEDHLSGLNRFKEGFGARYVEYAGEFDLPLRPSWYFLWRTAAPRAIALRRRLSRTSTQEQPD